MYKFPDNAKDKQEIKEKIRQICASNYSYRDGRILNSICSEPLDIAVWAYKQMLLSNLGDTRIFGSLKKMEQEVTAMLGNLLHNNSVAGNIVTGGTEANLLAMYVARQAGFQKGIKYPEAVASEAVHFSFNKACAFLGIKLITVKTDENFQVQAQELESKITKNTTAVIATAGTSETGTVEHIKETGEIAKKYGIYFHVDAASGGFLLPFMEDAGYKSVPFDFALESVDSITIDPHKYGMSVIPGGFILFRNRELMDYINFESFFHGTKAHTTLAGTRTGAGLASVYAVIHSLGYKGFVNNTKLIMSRREMLVNELHKRNIETAGRQDLNIIMVKSKDPVKIMGLLEKEGWLASVSKRYNAVRIVVHRHNSEDRLKEFAETFMRLENTLGKRI